MSGTVAVRLVRLIPPHLSFEQKFDLLKKVAVRNKNPIKVRLPVTSSPEEVIDIIVEAVQNAAWKDVSPSLQSRLTWLAQDDFQAVRILLREVIRREAVISSSYLSENIANFSRSIQHTYGDTTVQAEFEIRLLGTDVHVILNKGIAVARVTGGRKDGTAMNNEGDEKRESNELAKPVDDPNNLLNEALQRMSENKAREVMGKAADEALRLQVKRRERVRTMLVS